jgi:quinol monooxygenase YgiN
MSLACSRVPLAALALAGACWLALGATASTTAASPITVVTHVDIIPKGNNVSLATALLKQFVLASRSDPGVTSFTLITWAPTTNHFQLLEVFDSLEAFHRHVAAPHTIAFRTTAQQYIGAPFDERLYTRNKPDEDHR